MDNLIDVEVWSGVILAWKGRLSHIPRVGDRIYLYEDMVDETVLGVYYEFFGKRLVTIEIGTDNADTYSKKKVRR